MNENTKWIAIVCLSLSVLSLSLAGSTRTVSGTPGLVENFNNNKFNQAVWHTVIVGSGPSISVANESLVVSIPANSSNDPASAVFGAALTSNCELQGDFDLQVGFKLLVWPTSSGVRTGLGSSFILGGTGSSASPTPFTMSRDSFGFNDRPPSSELYLTNFADGVMGLTPTSNQTGTLRLSRTGGSATGYFLGSAGWVQVHTGPVDASSVGFGFGAWSHDTLFSHIYTQVAFDNFTLNSGSLLCPTLTADPSSGPVGTMVTLHGSGFPISQGAVIIGPTLEVTFDDQFIGSTADPNGSFTFVLNVPLAQAGQHMIKAIDLVTGANATAHFQVTAQQLSPSVSLSVGTIYFPGDTLVSNALVTSGRVPLGSGATSLSIVLTRPDNSRIALNVTNVGSGLFRSSYQIPRTATVGTYSLVAVAILPGVGNGTALATFEVKLPWLSSQGQTAIIGGGLATAGVIGVGIVSWRKGYFKKPRANIEQVC